MKKLLGLILSFFVSYVGIAQTFTQSAEGESSLLIRGSNLSLNSNKTQITFGANNLLKIYKDDKAWIYGGQLQGKNSEGIAGILSNNDISPEGKISGFFGRSRTYFTAPLTDFDKADAFVKERERLVDQYVKEMIEFVERNVHDVDYQKYLVEKIKDRDLFFPNEVNLPEIHTDQDGKNKKEMIIVREKAFRLKNILKPKIDAQSKKLEDEYNKDSLSSIPLESFFFYIKGGLLGQAFKFYDNLNQENFNDSFLDKTFTGSRVGLGANYRIGSIIYGVNFDLMYTNSFSSLRKSTFTIREENINASGQTLIKEKEYIAYTGTYERFWAGEANFDIIKRIPINSKNFIAFTPYGRWTYYTDERSLMPKHLDLGIGGYFFQSSGKFLGGLYAEVKDVSNEYEKLKEDPEFDPIYQKIEFGVLVSYSFSEILW